MHKEKPDEKTLEALEKVFSGRGVVNKDLLEKLEEGELVRSYDKNVFLTDKGRNLLQRIKDE
jgi:ribosomal protein S19E (S16A)